MSTLFAETDLIRLYVGDSHALDMLDDNSVDLTVTSPPYNINDNGSGVWQKEWYNEISDNLPESEYQADQVSVLDELYRVTKVGGVLCYNHKLRHRQYKLIHPLEWVNRSKWNLIGEIIWIRHATPNPNKSRFWDKTERIYVLCKDSDKPKYFNQDCATQWTDWKINYAVNTDHPAPYPYELPRRCIDAYTQDGDLVLDPYAGSGTTMVAAQNLNRRGVGIDLDKVYLEGAIKRLQKKGMF